MEISNSRSFPTGMLSRKQDSSKTAVTPITSSNRHGTVPVRTTQTGPNGEISRILTAFTLPLPMTLTEATTVYTRTKTKFTMLGMKPQVFPTRGPQSKAAIGAMVPFLIVDLFPNRLVTTVE